MLKIIAIYGPPCSGKTTLINFAKDEKYLAFDAEDLGNSYKERLKNSCDLFLRMANNEFLLIGAADLKPEDFPENTKFVILLPPFEEYKKRVAKRDINIPEKTGHDGMEYKYNEFLNRKENFDLRIIDNISIKESLKLILKLLIVEKD